MPNSYLDWKQRCLLKCLDQRILPNIVHFVSIPLLFEITFSIKWYLDVVKKEKVSKKKESV